MSKRGIPNKNSIRLIFLWLAALLWTALCLYLSWQPGKETAQTSQELAAPLLQALAVFGVAPEPEVFHLRLRLAAHFGVFYIDGLLLTAAFWDGFRQPGRAFAWGTAAGTVVAVAAEVAKVGIPGRHLTWSETGLNVVGTVCGSGTIWLAAQWAVHDGPRRSLLACKRAAAWCVRHVLMLFFFLPVKSGRILFFEPCGLGYGGSPKCISDYLYENDRNDTEIIWGFFRPEKHTLPSGVKKVRYHSPLWFYYYFTASAVVVNGEISQLHPRREKQFFINTWHAGGAYKRVGAEIPRLRGKSELKEMETRISLVDLFLSSGELFSLYTVRRAFRYQGAILNCGMPRNDIFFSAPRRHDAAERVRERYGLRGYTVLYAPTFRGYKTAGYKTDFQFPYEAVRSALEKRTGRTVTILKRAHPGGIMTDRTPPGVIDATDHPVMQELLCAADMLITDYSSSIWDYALLGRPCLLYIPDLEAYEAERGLFTPVESWPGIPCGSDGELLEAIRTLDENACAEKAARHLKELGSYETGTATEQAGKWIMSRINGGDGPAS